MRFLLQPLLFAWAGPASLIGLLLGVAALLTGGRAQRRSGVLEFYGGAAAWFLRHAPLVGNAMAMTLGHVVLGQTAAGLELARRHELVHVRQYERWGPLFLPLYALLSLWMWWQGRDPYRDNPFEREAFAAEELPPGQVG